MREFNPAAVPRPQLIFNYGSLGQSGPLDLEIGAGQGLHAIRYCQAHPERTLLAVEKTHARFTRLEGRQAAHSDLSNLKVLHADAVAFVSHFLPDDSLDRIFLLYPNPYPKPKQANLRWHNRPFFNLLLKKLKPNGELTLATNLKWYADEAEVNFTDQWYLQLISRTQVDANQPPRTHFEKKYLLRGETCHNLMFRKVSDVACHTRNARVE